MSTISLDIKEYKEEDGSVTLIVDQLDIYANALTRKDAINDLVTELQYYAEDYMNRQHQYFSDPQRRAHWKYIQEVQTVDKATLKDYFLLKLKETDDDR